MSTSRRREEGQRGQMIVLAALMMVVLLLFVGLAVDVGIVLEARRDLVRIADAAALAGAGALSSGQAGAANDWVREQRAVARAREYAELNGFDPDASGNTFSVEVTLSGRKLVTVNASRPVQLAFMRLVGINQVTVSAASHGRQAEAPPVDIVLVQDVSGSQCYNNMPPGLECEYIARDPSDPDGSSNYYKPYDATKPTVRSLPGRWFYYSSYGWAPGCRSGSTWVKCSSSPATSPINEPWDPFSVQQTAARYFVSQLDDRYDQIALVSFSSPGSSVYGSWYSSRLRADLTHNLATVINAIGSSPLTEGQTGSPGLFPGGNTNMAAGIRLGVQTLTGSSNARENAVPVMILLSDGTPTTRLDGSTPSGCNLQTGTGCSVPRQDTMAQAQIAADSGVLIYTIFVGTPTFAQTQALMLQYIADLTDNHRLEGSYSTLVSSGGPAYDVGEFQEDISQNYFLASDQDELVRAYDQILRMIYTRLVR